MSDPLPRTDLLYGTEDAEDLILVAHGGKEESDKRVGSVRPGLIRVLRFAEVGHKTAPEAAVGLLRYRLSGWNGERADPAIDLVEVVRSSRDQFRRILLIGHSMGARAVLRGAQELGVVGVLALSPWVPRDEPALSPSAAPTVLVTGSKDSKTPRLEARRYVERSRRSGTAIGYFEIEGAGHSFLTRAKEVDHMVRSFVRSRLLDGDPLIDDALSADPDRLPQIAPPQKDVWRLISGSIDIGRSAINTR